MSKILLPATKNKIKAYKAIVSHKRTLEITSLFEIILKKNQSISLKKILNIKNSHGIYLNFIQSCIIPIFLILNLKIIDLTFIQFLVNLPILFVFLEK